MSQVWDVTGAWLLCCLPSDMQRHFGGNTAIRHPGESQPGLAPPVLQVPASRVPGSGGLEQAHLRLEVGTALSELRIPTRGPEGRRHSLGSETRKLKRGPENSPSWGKDLSDPLFPLLYNVIMLPACTVVDELIQVSSLGETRGYAPGATGTGMCVGCHSSGP